VGALITALIQSSTATSVMTVGFVNAGLMTLNQAAGVIMGANIGTTITSVLIALDFTSVSSIMLFVGVFLFIFIKKDVVKHVGQALAGFGMMFMGLGAMSTAMEPLRDIEAFRNFMINCTNPILLIIIGTAFSALIHSSAASIAILTTLASSGLVDIKQALFILYGFNIGTVITSLISSLASKTNSKRTAMIHLLFNVFGTFLFVIISFIPGPEEKGLYVSLLEKITGNPVAQISAAHVIFNVGSTVILFPFSNILIKLSCLIIKDKEDKTNALQFEYYDERLLATPAVAVEQIGREAIRMAYLSRNNFNIACTALIDNNIENAEEIRDRERLINFLNHQITSSLVKINKLDLDVQDAKYIGRLYRVVGDLERIGDHAVNILEAAESRNKEGLKVTMAADYELKNIRSCVLELLDGAIDSFSKQSLPFDEAVRLNTLEHCTDELKEEYIQNHIERLNEQESETRAGIMFVNSLVDFERVGDHANNIAWAVKDKPDEQVGIDENLAAKYITVKGV
ncbi:MAG: Na/Pi cotransporter family protein, partial [Clostridiales bacterium]|nr:Na/Pi cotransporter family protein [Clostridiales bacterium]